MPCQSSNCAALVSGNGTGPLRQRQPFDTHRATTSLHRSRSRREGHHAALDVDDEGSLDRPVRAAHMDRRAAAVAARLDVELLNVGLLVVLIGFVLAGHHDRVVVAIPAKDEPMNRS